MNAKHYRAQRDAAIEERDAVLEANITLVSENSRLKAVLAEYVEADKAGRQPKPRTVVPRAPEAGTVPVQLVDNTHLKNGDTLYLVASRRTQRGISVPLTNGASIILSPEGVGHVKPDLLNYLTVVPA